MPEDTKLGAMRNELIALYMSYDRSINQAKSYETMCELIKRRSRQEEKIIRRYGLHVNRTLDKGPLWKDAEKELKREHKTT